MLRRVSVRVTQVPFFLRRYLGELAGSLLGQGGKETAVCCKIIFLASDGPQTCCNVIHRLYKLQNTNKNFHSKVEIFRLEFSTVDDAIKGSAVADFVFTR